MENDSPASDRDKPGESSSVQSLENKKRKPFAHFLIESEIKPFVFVGRCMQYFGMGAVVGFILGAAALYLYALFYPLPGIARVVTTQVQPQSFVDPPQRIRLHGLVINESGKPTTELIKVGILASQHGPIRDGSFTIDVAPSSSYDIALWNMGAERMEVYEGFSADKDGDKYVLPPLPFTRSIQSSLRPNSIDESLIVWRSKSEKQMKQLSSE